MSPRPPPKISLRHDHDWTRGKVQLGSTVDQQPEGKVVRQSRGEVQNATFSQLTQPIPKPICDRSGQPEDTQGVFVVKGETSRSHEIDEKGFHEKLCASDRSGQPEITLSVIEARNLSENTRVEQTHDGSGQPDECNSSSAHTVKEQHAPDEHREIASFKTNNEFNRAINEEDIDFNIPGVPHSTVKQLHGASVRDLIQKIENHPHRHALQSDLHQSQSFNPFSPESKDMIREVGNIELCELLDMEPKAQCKVCLSCWDVGIVYCTCGHFLRNGTEENKKFVQYTMDLLSIPNYYIKKGRPHGHRYGKKPGDYEYFVANSLKKKCKKKNFLGIHDRFIRDEKFRKNMFDVGRSEELCREMDKLANEDHTHHITPEEIIVYRNNWWIRSNTVGSAASPPMWTPPSTWLSSRPNFLTTFYLWRTGRSTFVKIPQHSQAGSTKFLIDGHVRPYTAAPCAPAFLQEARMNGMWLPRECVLGLLRAACRLKSARMVSGLERIRTEQCLSMRMG